MSAALPAPFFEAPGTDAARRRLLLISYHFPPGQTAGALRWQKLARFAHERGWELDVITLDPSSLARPEMERLAELPPGTRVFGVPERDTMSARVPALLSRARRMARGVRNGGAAPGSNGANGNGARPRPGSVATAELRWLIRTPAEFRRTLNAWLLFRSSLRWAEAAGAVAARVLDGGRHRAVVTCGPPHMEHVVGRRLAERAGVPLIMDYRDPWSSAVNLPEPFASRLWQALAERYERRALAGASLLVANSDRMRDTMRRLYPEARERIITVMNGCDDHDAVPAARGGPFVVAYAGSIYLGRDPRPLFRAAGRLVRELGLEPSDLRIELMGRVQQYGGVPTERLAAEEGVEGFVGIHPHGSHAEVKEFLARATMLVSLPQEAANAIPSKIFEYMQHEAWLLVFANPGTAPAQLLEGSEADVVAPDDVEQLTAVLRRRFMEYREGRVPPRLGEDDRFSRRGQARVLLDAIDACVARS